MKLTNEGRAAHGGLSKGLLLSGERIRLDPSKLSLASEKKTRVRPSGMIAGFGWMALAALGLLVLSQARGGPLDPNQLYILSQPQSLNVPYGASATFTVSAAGVPPFAYQWQFDGTNLTDNAQIVGSQSNILTISNVQAVLTGNYQVIVTNIYAVATSSVAVLNAGNPPSIVTQPLSTNAATGASATFSVVAASSAPLGYQWLFHGAALPGANASNLTISPVTVGKSGLYGVMVTNLFGAVTSSNATLAISTPPVILQQPANAEVAVGASTVFHVVAAGSGPFTWQWMFDNTYPIVGATNNSYSVTNAQLTNEGYYSVVISTPAGSLTSSNVLLFVETPPPPPPPTPSYTINLLPGLNLIANQLNNGGNTLGEIMPVVPDGSVVSKYINSSGTWLQSTYNAALGGWVPPNVSLSPGEGAFLNSPSNYSLTMSGTPQTPGLPITIPNGVAYLLSRQTNDIGTYENIVGTAAPVGAIVYKWMNATTNYAAYTNTETGWTGGTEPTAAVGESVWIGTNGGAPVPILQAPIITQQPVSASAALGGSALFSVSASGGLPLSYQWRLDANQIPGATNSSLAISNVQLTNVGNYSVAIQNPIGVTDSVVVSLTITNEPSLPLSDQFTNIGNLGTANSGVGFGSNIGATSEPGEPTPDAIPIGAPVWGEWTPQFDGIASFSTAGSSFDTVLAVCVANTSGPPALNNLTLVTANAGSAPYLWSSVNFNVSAGTTYYLQVSGFYGDMGTVALSWNLAVTAAPAPVILVPPASQSVPPGSDVTLSVTLAGAGPYNYQWLLDNQPVDGDTNSTLTLSNLDLTSTLVGYWTVQVTDPVSLESATSTAAHIAVVSTGPGFTGNAAFISGQTTFQNATALTPPDPNIIGDPAPCGGYTGAINDGGNTLASAQPDEPNHCGYTPCHSVWYSYVSPANGLLTLSVFNNNFDSVLAVYTGPGTNFATLVPVACSANHGSAGESVTFSTTTGKTNWIVVDGVNCASGNYVLGWTNAAPPAIAVQPAGQVLMPGSQLTLSATASGAPSLSYQWMINGTSIPGATAPSLVLPNFQATNAGDYQLEVSNPFGVATSLAATVGMPGSNLVTTATSPPGLGSTSGDGSYISGQIVTVTATPTNGCYGFVNWTLAGAVVSTSPSYTFIATKSAGLVANYVLNTYTVTTASQPTAGGATTGSGSYSCGSSLTVTATPTPPYQFVNWTVGGVPVSTNATFTSAVSSSETLVANFSEQVVITVLASPTYAGTVTPTTIVTNTGRQLSLVAQANTSGGWKFTQWSDGSPHANDKFQINQPGNYTYTAYFAPTSFSLSGGSLSAAGFTFVLNGPATTYRIDISTDMINWLPLTVFTTTGLPFSFTDPAAAGQEQRFYRVVWLSP